MKTRRASRILRRQHGGVKARPINELNALTSRMGTLRVGSTKRKALRFGAKPKKRPTRTVGTTVIQRPHAPKKSKKPTKTLRTFIKSGLVPRKTMKLNMMRFEPAQYIRKVGEVFEGLGEVRTRIETVERAEFLSEFDMIVGGIYEGLPNIRAVMNNGSINNSNGRNAEDIEGMLEEIEELGEELMEVSRDYLDTVRESRRNASALQIKLIAIAETLNEVLRKSVVVVAAKPRRANSPDINALVSQMGKMNMKGSSVDDLSALFAGLGM